MRLSIVAAIRYLEENTLALDDAIVIDLWGDEGYELQALARESEGSTTLSRDLDFYISDENGCKNSQLNCLMRAIGGADLGIQFIDSYPAHDGVAGGLNLIVIIMHRKTLQNALRRFDRYLPLAKKSEASARRLHGTNSGALKPRDTPVLSMTNA